MKKNCYLDPKLFILVIWLCDYIFSLMKDDIKVILVGLLFHWLLKVESLNKNIFVL